MPTTAPFKMTVLAFEVAAVAVLIFGALLSFGAFIKRMIQGTEGHEAYRAFRQGFGTALLLALDLLVAADIILTVTVDLSFETLGMLGLLIFIRTFLHFVLELEVTGRWPWQSLPAALGKSGKYRVKTPRAM
jgi:uncharacterized membrane protein